MSFGPATLFRAASLLLGVSVLNLVHVTSATEVVVDETKSFTFGTRSYASFSQAQFGGRDVETSKDELVLLLRTRASSGLLALLVAGDDFFVITLDAGYVTLHFGLGADTQALVQTRVRVNDAAWHKVVVVRDGLLASITIDDLLQFFVKADGSASDKLSLPDTLYVGGVPDPDTFGDWPRGKYQPFRGCLTGLKFNGKNLQFDTGSNNFVTSTCTSDPGVCNPNPCVNPTPVCVDTWNAFTCTCRDGFIGADCEVNVDDCRPDSCMNGGTCVDGFNTFSCRCRPEWYGEVCQTQCDQGNCVGTVACDEVTGGSRKCLACEDGWYGIACDQPCPGSKCGTPATRCDQLTGAVDCPACQVGMFGSRALDSRLRSDCELPCPSTSACLEPVQCQKETGLPLVCRRCARGLFGIDCGLNCEQGDCVGLVACDLDGGSRSCAACRSGYWDPTCTERCTQGSCLGVVTCDQSDGKQRKCALCKAGTWGDSCGRTCKASNCLGEVVCHQQTGETLRCNRCKPGFFGPDCSARCTESFCVEKTTCDIDTGVSFCPTCMDGYWGVADKATRQGDCAKSCTSSTCAAVTTCDRVSGASFSCSSCLPGFYGPLCEKKCRQGDCVGTVSCAKKDGRNRKCEQCRDGFWGPMCSQKCQRGKCLGAVRCDMVTGGSRLCQLCQPGAWGRDCTETCNAETCKGKPDCDQNTGDVLSCKSCRVGFWSTACSSECTQGRCITPVSCDQVTGSDRTCDTCKTGFYGPGCDFACPRGKCIGEVDCSLDKATNKLSRVCLACIEGFTGADCEEDLDECSSTSEVPVCQNGGACVNEFGGYRCDCTQGFGGRNCENKLNGCIIASGGDRCMYGGNCTDILGGFSCNCQPGYVGNRCERQTTISLAQGGSLQLPSLKGTEIDVLFGFRTTEAYGTILYNAGVGDDYLLLEVVAGNLLLRLGFGTPESQFELVVGNGTLHDGRFHAVALRVLGRKVDLAVDGGNCGDSSPHVCQDIKVVPGTGSAILDIGGPLQIGLPGAPSSDTATDRLHNLEGFSGCIKELIVTGAEVNFLTASKAFNVLPGCRISGSCADDPCRQPAVCRTGVFGEATCVCPAGIAGGRCDSPAVPVSFLGANRIQLAFEHANHVFQATTEVSFRFRTRAETGTLMLIQGSVQSDDFILIDLDAGRIRATVRHGKRAVSAVDATFANDAQWHDVVFRRDHSSTFFSLAVNGSMPVTGVFASAWTQLDLVGGAMLLGGLPTDAAAERIVAAVSPPPASTFLGCLQDLRVQGRQVNLLEPEGFTRSAFGGLSVGCTSTDVCAANGPCPVGKSSCVDNWNEAVCECFPDFGPPGNCLKNTSVPDPCLSNPCQNGGGCSSKIEVDPLTADTTSEFQCTCPANYVGYLCQVECTCVNGGICAASNPLAHDGRGHTCKCPVQYSGTDCSTDVDECASDRWPCKQSEFCVQANVTANNRCDPRDSTCHTGWKGYSCIAVGPCGREMFETYPATLTTDRVCQAATPRCTPGLAYESQQLRPTSDRVCTPLSRCSVGEYETVAATSSTDRRCGALSACLPAQVETLAPTATSDRVCVTCECRNQGQCRVLNTLGGSFKITCDCPVGYNGTLCELEGCVEGVCPDRICVEDASQGHRCICPPGLAGENCLLPDSLESCERDNFCTAPNECRLSESGGITCVCPSNTTGCETQVVVASNAEPGESNSIDIVPIIVGLCLAIVLLIAIVLVVIRRRRRGSKDLEPVEDTEPTPELFPLDRMI